MMATGGRKTNWFAIWVSVAVVVVLVVVGILVAALNNQATAPGPTPEGASIDSATGAISVGEGPDVLATYVDFICPACGQFEQSYGPTIQGVVDDGSITLDIHPIAILDSQSQGTRYSSRAASAMYCVAVADPEASLPFLTAMYENQPPEATSGLTDEEIVTIAESVGVTDASDCITEGRYMDYVTRMTPETPVKEGAGGISTPTVVLNDEILTLTGDPQADILDRLQG